MPDLAPGILTEYLNDDVGCFVESTGLIASVKSDFQTIEIHATATFGKLLRIDNHFMLSENDEFIYHETLVHVAAVTHPEPRTALIIGGGDGGALEELLKHPSIESVTLAEIDRAVIDFAIAELSTVHRGAFGDPRVTVHIGDGFDFVAKPGKTFDLIVLDLTDPGGPSEPLYTQEFYRNCAARLNPGGALTLQVASPVVHAERIGDVLSKLRTVFPVVRPYLVPVPLYNGLWMLAYASVKEDPATLAPAEVDTTIKTRGLSNLEYYNGDVHRALFALPNFVQRLVVDRTQ